jgi:hypothetical protein
MDSGNSDKDEDDDRWSCYSRYCTNKSKVMTRWSLGALGPHCN